MHLRVLLPFRVFAEIQDVSRIVIETSAGSCGLLPQRLDFVAALVPGIFTYQTEAGEVNYLAVDEGVLIKAGSNVTLSVRNAVGGKDLGSLHELIKKEFMSIDESEKNTRSVMVKLESGLIHSLEKFKPE